MTGEPAWIVWTVAAAVLILAALAWWVWLKGRPFASGDIFSASRLSAGNHLFPTQVLVTPTSVGQYIPRAGLAAGRNDSHGPHRVGEDRDRHAAVERPDRNERRHRPDCLPRPHQGDAVAMKNLIERYQTDYYQRVKP